MLKFGNLLKSLNVDFGEQIENGTVTGHNGNLIRRWRKYLSQRLYEVVALAGFFVVVPSVSWATMHDLWLLTFSMVFAVAGFTVFYLFRRFTNLWMNICFLMMFYVIGILTLLSHGLVSFIFFNTLSLLSVILISSRVALLLTFVSTVTMATVGYVFDVDTGKVSHVDPSFMHWAIISLNFFAQNCVIVWAFSFLFDGIQTTLKLQRQSMDRLQANSKKMEHWAMHDAMTGLANRRYFHEELANVLAACKRKSVQAAVVVLDLDHFKNINDVHGHQMGDELVIAVAKRLENAVRSVDTVARLGGDEFVVILADLCNGVEVDVAVKRILTAISGEYALARRTLPITASAGVAVFPRDGKDEETLLKYADTAMYRAKELGRNGYQFFKEEMRQRLQERIALEESLRVAIERDQFLLHFQPRISAHDGLCRSAEVLLRWNHPQLGFVSPLRFIPVAEDTGLIVPIGAWVLRSAAAQLLVWQSQFPQLRLSINVSAREFSDLTLAGRIWSATQGLQPNSLEIEITESLVIENLLLAQQLLDKVRSQGLSVAIDDFGTGLSSLAYLKNLPLDVIKIDKSFIDGVGHDRQSHAIVKTIVDLANNLQLSTVAEGVETSGQADVLRSMGVKEFQGYYFARPMPAQAFESFLNNQPKSAAQAALFPA